MPSGGPSAVGGGSMTEQPTTGDTLSMRVKLSPIERALALRSSEASGLSPLDKALAGSPRGKAWAEVRAAVYALECEQTRLIERLVLIEEAIAEHLDWAVLIDPGEVTA